jgi:uncharacterized membrane protein YebE (DUF533 family)
MKPFRQIIAAIAFVSFMVSASVSNAAENSLREVFQDAFYGAGVGALVGGALLVFTKKPADHLDYIGYGAAVGVLAGTAYGLAKSAKALAEIDNGRIRIAVPTIVPDLIESKTTGQTSVMWHANILRGTFN